MRKLMFSALILWLLPEAHAADQLPQVRKLENGFYASQVLESTAAEYFIVGSRFNYIVDSTAGICYMSRVYYESTDLQIVPCKSLKKRPEWASIITWE